MKALSTAGLLAVLRSLSRGFWAFVASLAWTNVFAVIFCSIERRWSYWESFIFACCVISTIGYGNKVPQTDAGKLCVIACGLFIPVFVLAVKWSGENLRFVLEVLLKRAARCCNQPPPKGWRKSLIYTVSLFFYFGHAVVIYCAMEQWSVVEATYYVFCAFTTIGLGDYVPVSSGGYEQAAPLTWYHIWHFFVVLFGLSIIGMAFDAAFGHVEYATTVLGEAASKQAEVRWQGQGGPGAGKSVTTGV